MRNWNPMICRSGSSWLYQSLSLLVPCCSKSHNGIAVDVIFTVTLLCKIFDENIWMRWTSLFLTPLPPCFAPYLCACVFVLGTVIFFLYIWEFICVFFIWWLSWWLLGYMLVYFSCFAIDFVSVFWMVSVWGCFLLAFHFGHHLSEIWSLKALASFSSSSVCL